MGWYLSLVSNGLITISIGARSLEIGLPQQSVNLFLKWREYLLPLNFTICKAVEDNGLISPNGFCLVQVDTNQVKTKFGDDCFAVHGIASSTASVDGCHCLCVWVWRGQTGRFAEQERRSR